MGPKEERPGGFWFGPRTEKEDKKKKKGAKRALDFGLWTAFRPHSLVY